MSFLTTLNQTLISKTVDDDLKFTYWREAMNEETRALVQNHARDIVHKPPNKTYVGCSGSLLSSIALMEH